MDNLYFKKFIQTFNEFIKEIRDICVDDDLYDKIVIQSNLTDPEKTLTEYYQKANKNVNDFSTQNAIIINNEEPLLMEINLYQLWNMENDSLTQEGIWKYLFTLYLYSYLYMEKKELGEIIKKYKKIDPDDVIDSHKIIYSVIDKVNNEKRIDKLSKMKKTKEKNDSGFPNLTEGLLGGEIGKLAMEIANEINPEDFEKDFQGSDPQEMLSGLFSGNIDQQSPIMNLVNKIGSKIHQKVNDGKINETDLLSEAQGIMGNTNLFGNGDIKNPNLSNIHNLSKTMADNINKNNLKQRKKNLNKKLAKKKKQQKINMEYN